MAENNPIVVIDCPQCTNKLSVDQTWIGTLLQCPSCGKKFMLTREVLFPKKIALPQKHNHGSTALAYQEQEMSKAQIALKWTFRALLVIGLLAAGIWLYVKITTVTPEKLKGNQLYVMTPKRQNRDGAAGMCEIVRADFFPIAHTKSDFFYRDVNFKNIYLESAGYEQYRGTVTFTRNDKNLITRPIFIDRQASFTNYHFPFKYKDNPEYLLEDAYYLYKLAASYNKKLEGWELKSAELAGGNNLSCVITKNGSEKTIKLKAEQVDCDDKIGRIWVEVISKL